MSTIAYVLHNPLDNAEAPLTNYEPTELAEAQANGLVIIAIDEHGDRTIITNPDDVHKPDNTGIQVVLPAYVDQRMTALDAILDAIDTILTSATTTTRSRTALNNTATTTTEPATTPIQAFHTALAAFKQLIADSDETNANQ